MTRFTLHVPEQYNSGQPVGDLVFDSIEALILERAEGFTVTRGGGAWRDPDTGQVYREPVRLYTVDGPPSLVTELRELAGRIASALEQEAVYFTSAEITPALVAPTRIAPPEQVRIA